ncbi:GDP-mannose 4,6 dehydratase [Natrinema hispanicum]|uniref:GDP-mannose 4,6 dehydratase n=1 Tax=Natrinema hispanicum TaxID=392421 RepID=A0A1I0JMV0_9EURY|nr:GDP-mannose 4,6 dehydratase [Natrinema hispanicum]
MNLLEAARHNDLERVVLAASSSVYGKPEYLPYDKDHPTNPVSPYGVSKFVSEQYARVYNEIQPLRCATSPSMARGCGRTWR